MDSAQSFMRIGKSRPCNRATKCNQWSSLSMWKLPYRLFNFEIATDMECKHTECKWHPKHKRAMLSTERINLFEVDKVEMKEMDLWVKVVMGVVILSVVASITICVILIANAPKIYKEAKKVVIEEVKDIKQQLK